MAKMSFDNEGLVDEPCLSCGKSYVEDIHIRGGWTWHCDEKECPYKEESEDKGMARNDILVIRAPYLMKKEAMNKAYDQILKQMESGLVMVPEGFSVALCPKDVEVKLMDSGNDIFKEEEDD